MSLLDRLFKPRPKGNSLLTIFPYWCNETWVFDDEDVDLVREPFVQGTEDIISRVVDELGIANAREGFRIVFSATKFPGHHLHLTRLHEEDGGYWYEDEYGERGWLCPATLHYFEQHPMHIYASFHEAESHSD